MKIRNLFVLGVCLVAASRQYARGDVIIVGLPGFPGSDPSGTPQTETILITQAIQYTITTAYTGDIYFEFEHGGKPFGDIQTLNLAYTIDGAGPYSIQGGDNVEATVDFALLTMSPGLCKWAPLSPWGREV